MGHLNSSGLPDPKAHSGEPPARGRWWIWVLAAIVVLGGIWYFHGGHTETQALNSGAAGANSYPAGGFGGGVAPAVPVVVTTAQHGDVPVYFDGLGTVTAYNTVTVRSRVDGAIVSVNFTEGQFVHQGDALVRDRSATLPSCAGAGAGRVGERPSATQRRANEFGTLQIVIQRRRNSQAASGYADKRR